MTWVASAIVTTGVISAGVGAYSAYLQNTASKDAAESIGRSMDEQLEFEKERAADEKLRYEATALEEKRRSEAWTATEQARYDEIKLEEKTRYAAKTATEKTRYDQQWKFFEDLNVEDQKRFQEAKKESQARYESEKVRVAAMTKAEQERYAASAERIGNLDIEEQIRFYERKEEEQTRFMSLESKEQDLYETQLGERGIRFEKAEALVKPFLSSAEAAQEQLNIELGLAPGEAGTAYMETPGYKQAMEERQAGVEQTAATMGEAYSGRRMKEASKAGSAVHSKYYDNYMNMLMAQADPATAEALANMGVTQQQVGRNLPGMGELDTGTPGSGQTLGVGSPYSTGPNGEPLYEKPGVGSVPGSVYMSGSPPPAGSGTYTPPPGSVAPPPVGGGLVSGTTSAESAGMQGPDAWSAYIADTTGMTGNILTEYIRANPAPAGYNPSGYNQPVVQGDAYMPSQTMP